MPLASKLTPEQILHEHKCSKKIKELYGPRSIMLGHLSALLSAGVGVGTFIALKGRTVIVRQCSCNLTANLTLGSILTYWFDVSVFFQIIITKLT